MPQSSKVWKECSRRLPGVCEVASENYSPHIYLDRQLSALLMSDRSNKATHGLLKSADTHDTLPPLLQALSELKPDAPLSAVPVLPVLHFSSLVELLPGGASPAIQRADDRGGPAVTHAQLLAFVRRRADGRRRRPRRVRRRPGRPGRGLLAERTRGRGVRPRRRRVLRVRAAQRQELGRRARR